MMPGSARRPAAPARPGSSSSPRKPAASSPPISSTWTPCCSTALPPTPPLRKTQVTTPNHIFESHRIGQFQRPPHRRIARLRAQDPGVMGQRGDVVYAGGPSAIATAMETSRRPGPPAGTSRPAPAPIPGRRSARPGRPACAVVLPRRARLARRSYGDPQPVVPRRILHREERSCYWQLQVYSHLVISQNQGALSAIGALRYRYLPGHPRTRPGRPGRPPRAPHPSGAHQTPASAAALQQNRRSTFPERSANAYSVPLGESWRLAPQRSRASRWAECVSTAKTQRFPLPRLAVTSRQLSAAPLT